MHLGADAPAIVQRYKICARVNLHPFENDDPILCLEVGVEKFLFAFILFFVFEVKAQTVLCQIQDSFKGTSSKQELSIEVREGQNFSFTNRIAAQSSLKLEGESILLNLNGGLLKKPLLAKMGARSGSSLRLQVIPSERESNYLMIDCQVEGSGSFESVSAGRCELIETVGAQKLSTIFEVPVSQSGHDIFVIPTAQIAPLEGWVMFYNGVLVTSLQNKNIMTGVTTIGSWSQETLIQWYPSSQNIKVTLSCFPLVAPH